MALLRLAGDSGGGSLISGSVTATTSMSARPSVCGVGFTPLRDFSPGSGSGSPGLPVSRSPPRTTAPSATAHVSKRTAGPRDISRREAPLPGGETASANQTVDSRRQPVDGPQSGSPRR